jgi:hypothetical protein
MSAQKNLQIYWQGDFKEHSHLSKKNLFNAFLCFTVLLPSFILTYYLFQSETCPEFYPKSQ